MRSRLAVLLPTLSFLLLCGCGVTRIEPGHVGVKVNLAGTERGVQDVPVVTGWVFYNPFTQAVYEWPTFVQTAQFTKEEDDEGSPGDEQLTFNSSEGMQIAADVSLSYKIKAESVPHFFVEFRTDDLARFTHGYMHNVLRDMCNEAAGKYGVEDIYGPKKDLFLADVRERFQKQLEPFGVIIVQLGFIGAPRIPENVRDQLNIKVQATQSAMTAENQLRTAKANAEIAVAEAEGKRRAMVAAAEGEKMQSILRADGQAEANRRVAQSITNMLLEWERLQVAKRWDGSLPSVQVGTGGTGMFLQLPIPAGKKP